VPTCTPGRLHVSNLSRRHHNVFVYYRGPSAQKISQQDAHSQVEDNATKALINVLEHGEDRLARSFAGRFAPQTVEGWPDRQAGYHLQGGPPNVSAGARVLLGISLEAALDTTALPKPPEAVGRIDAAIVPPHGGLIAIETKIVDNLDPHQLERHRIDWDIAPADTRLVRWVEIWTWARSGRELSTAPVTRFLLEQFCEYLEILGFGRWAGFREEDFDQFTTWSWNHQPVLRARMRSAWERVLELMAPEDAAWLGAIAAGNLPKSTTSAWAQTNRMQPGTNLTLQLGADELQLNLVGWNAGQAARLEKWLLAHPQDAPDVDLVIYERRAQPDHKGKPFWMHATYTISRILSADEIHAGSFGPWLDAWRASSDPTWSRLAYHLRQSWSREQVLAQGESLGAEIAALATQTLPLLRNINRWKAPAGP
jgi:hypothetical protein